MEALRLAMGMLVFGAVGCGGDDEPAVDGGEVDTGGADAGVCGPCERPCCDYDQATGMRVAPFCPPPMYECGGPPLPDAGEPDAGERDGGETDPDSGPAADGGMCECIDAPLSFGWTGGFTAYEDTSTVAPCSDYTLVRDDRSGGTTMCTNEVPCAGEGVTMAELLAALAHPDVRAAFMAAPVTYGRDLRPVDAPIYQVSQSGRTFLVGSPCTSGAGDCMPIPPGVQALVDLLEALTAERNAEEPCASTFPP